MNGFSRTQSFWRLHFVGALSIACLSANPVAAEVMVVASSGPSAERFVPGRVLPQGAQIELQRNDAITLLDADGTRVVRGPQSFSVGAQSSTDQTSRLSVLFNRAAANRTRSGATRDYRSEVLGSPAASGGAQSASRSNERSPTLWHIDPSLSGNWCYFDPEAIELWRTEASGAENMSFRNDGGRTVNVRWSLDENFIFWPYAMYPEDGTQYFVQSEAFGHYLTLHQVELKANLLEFAESLEASECYYQLELLAGEEQ